jgi:hypothetical protein
VNVVPKKRYDGELVVLPASGHHVMECVVTSPLSSMGRTVYLVLSDEDVTTVLLSLREHAIHVRSKSMEAGQ